MRGTRLFLAACATAACGAALFAPCANASEVENVLDHAEHVVGDLTGDGVVDTIQVKTAPSDEYGFRCDLTVYVNGKLIKQFDSAANIMGARVLNFDNGKSALHLIWGMGSRLRDPHGLFTFPNGDSMRQDVDLSTLYPGGNGIGSNISVAGNTATAKVYVHGYSSGDPAHSDFDYSVKFKWSGDKLVRASNTCKILDPQWTATQYSSYKIYKTPGSKKLVTIVKKGAMAKPVKIRFVSKKVYMQVKTKAGKVGWYRA